MQSGRYGARGPATPAIRGNPDAGTDRLFQCGFGLCKGVPPASQSGPVPPQLADFDQSLQDYKKQIEAELEQEAAAAGLTVEEYVASDYEAPAQPNFSIYQVPPGPEGRDLRYRSYEDLQADGLSVDRKNYQLVYTAPLDKDTTLDEIYRRFNIEHPADYKGHSLSTGDIVVFRQDGKQTAYYVDEGADYRQVPEFFAQPEKQLPTGAGNRWRPPGMDSTTSRRTAGI